MTKLAILLSMIALTSCMEEYPTSSQAPKQQAVTNGLPVTKAAPTARDTAYDVFLYYLNGRHTKDSSYCNERLEVVLNMLASKTIARNIVFTNYPESCITK